LFLRLVGGALRLVRRVSEWLCLGSGMCLVGLEVQLVLSSFLSLLVRSEDILVNCSYYCVQMLCILLTTLYLS
jgi:hypothetical protein